MGYQATPYRLASSALTVVSFIFVALTAASGEAANVTKVLKKNERELTSVCGSADPSCPLKTIYFSAVDESSQSPGEKHPFFRTILHAGFETKTWSDIDHYGFVQYIRGCTFESQKGPNGKVIRRVEEVIQHYLLKNTFAYPEWTYDANTLDPLYYGPLKEDSKLPGGRLALYDWAPSFSSFKKSQMKPYYEVLKLSEKQRSQMTPRLVVKDLPSPAYVPGSGEGKIFKNVALDFKICLYHMKDIPLEVTSEKPIPGAIACFDWDSQFEFNHDKNTYEHHPGAGLHAFCATQKAESPAEVWKREVESRQREAQGR